MVNIRRTADPIIDDVIEEEITIIAEKVSDNESMTVREAGKKGGYARKKQIQDDPNMSYKKLGQMGGTVSHGKNKK